MLKNVLKFEEKIGDRNYTAFCESDSPTADAKEFAFRLLKFIGQVEDQAAANASQVKAEESNVPEVKEEPKMECQNGSE